MAVRDILAQNLPDVLEVIIIFAAKKKNDEE
jgi:hypothetical protein